MSNDRSSWNPMHGYILVALLGTALSAPVLLSSRTASASKDPIAPSTKTAEPRALTVRGTAEVITTPDELTLSFRIDTFDRSLKQAKSDNDQKAQKALKILAEGGIPGGSIQTDNFSIQPRYEGPYEHRTLTGYDVVKHITATHCNLEQSERLLGQLFEGSANVLEGVSFASSKLQEKRAEARKLALQAAREKAEAAAKELGQRLGHPLRIDESAEPLYGEMQANLAYRNDSQPSGGPTLAAGKMKIQSTVTVVFEILDP